MLDEWHGRGCRAEIPGVATDPGAFADARWRGVTRLPGIVRATRPGNVAMENSRFRSMIFSLKASIDIH